MIYGKENLSLPSRLGHQESDMAFRGLMEQQGFVQSMSSQQLVINDDRLYRNSEYTGDEYREAVT
jgi:hypothetical protein